MPEKGKKEIEWELTGEFDFYTVFCSQKQN